MAIRELPYNELNHPHFLVIDELHDLVRWGHQDKSIVQFLIGAAASHCGVYVFASYGYTTNIKTEKATKSLAHGNILRANTVGKNMIKVNNTDIWVPDPV
jgi:hypothetical protein